MSTRKHLSGYEKLLKKRKIEKQIESQKGSMDKFVTKTYQKELEDDEIIQQKENNENSPNNVETSDVTIIDNEKQNNLEENEKMTNLLTNNIYDPIEKGAIRENDLKFPLDKERRHFATTFYFKKLSNGEKFDRRWLAYSKDLDKAFCLCCKLFNSTTHGNCTNQLTNEGTNDWRNISHKIKNHETSKEHIYQENNGNFLSLIEMIAEFDPVMQEHVQRIQHANEIKGKIIKKIKEAKYFSIILDCTLDVSHQEQMTLVLQDKHFVEFLKVDDTSGKGLFNEIISVIKRYGNGSNMKGKKQGVQKRIIDINPRAFYTPCGCHNLNLVLCDVANSCPKAISFFGVRWKILQDNVSSLTLKPLSQTRWESRIESVKAIKFQALEIRDALLQLVKTSEDPKTKSEADCLATYELESFEFLLDMHIDIALDQLKEDGFTSAMISSKEIAIKMEIEKKQFDENVNDEITQSAEESFRINYFLYIVDQAISSIENLYSELIVLKEVVQIDENTPINVLNYLKRLDSFPNAYIAYRILLTISVTVASAERKRLSGLAILSIEKEMLEELKYKNLISNFASQKARKIDFK
ncbi:hypothetical protein RGQ29_023577 [Quercus rubra]|uniref:TTF-type domain-containing protein n=1 Tax=Quercus rubra TaxID=3512 RepID=A0AAN7F7X5_QUERU|nr:hypothetical protein RGQ29_023577 [Quercus rubra]